VWGTFNDALREKWKGTRTPSHPSSREAGQIKNTLLQDYDLPTVLQMCRLVVWDWEAIKSEWRSAYKTPTKPTINNLVSMRRDLAQNLDSGVTSQQKRVSRYREKFLKAAQKKGELGWDD